MKYFRSILLLAVSLALLIALVDTQGYAQELEVEVISISGYPRVRKSGERKLTEIEEGMFLSAGDMIKTEVEETVELSFDEDNKSVVRVDSNSEVLLTFDNEKIKLLSGRVFSIVEDLPQEAVFEIRTPTAVTGVKGTEWVTSFEEEETAIEAVDGTPYVKSIDASGKVAADYIIVHPGYMTKVKRFQKPAVLKPIPPKELMKWRYMRSEIRKHAREAFDRREPGYRPRYRPLDKRSFMPQEKPGEAQKRKVEEEILKPILKKRVVPPPQRY